MSMEEILQLKEKLGSKLYNRALSSNCSLSETKGPGRKKGMYRYCNMRYTVFMHLISAWGKSFNNSEPQFLLQMKWNEITKIGHEKCPLRKLLSAYGM